MNSFLSLFFHFNSCYLQSHYLDFFSTYKFPVNHIVPFFLDLNYMLLFPSNLISLFLFTQHLLLYILLDFLELLKIIVIEKVFQTSRKILKVKKFLIKKKDMRRSQNVRIFFVLSAQTLIDAQQ